MRAQIRLTQAEQAASNDPENEDIRAVDTGRPRNTRGSDAASQETDSRPPLSAREFDVLYWLAEGKSGAEIARILGISLGTVRVHIRNINLKLNASNIPHAVAQGFKRGILGR